MGNCKTQAIQADLDIFKHISAYSGVWIFRNIQAYSEGSCVTLEHWEPWYIWNPSIFKTSGMCKTLVYSKPGIFRTRGIFSYRV